MHSMFLRKCPSTIRHLGAQSGLNLQAERCFIMLMAHRIAADQIAPVTYTQAVSLSIPDSPGTEGVLLSRSLHESWHGGNCLIEVIKLVKAEFGMCKRKELGMSDEAQRCIIQLSPFQLYLSFSKWHDLFLTNISLLEAAVFKCGCGSWSWNCAKYWRVWLF